MALTRLRTKVAKPGSARFALTLFAALGFFLQSFIAQTHLHAVSRTGTATSIVAGVVVDHQDKQNPRPGNDDPANCPTCQQLAHAGTYITPVVSYLQEPSQPPMALEQVAVLHSDDFILSHAWRSRAPPSA